MTDRDCSKILDGFIVNESGDLVLDESFREHLSQCRHCQQIYANVQKAKDEEVPDFVTPVMKRIRKIESVKRSNTWYGKLTEIFESFQFFSPRFLLPAVATIAVLIMVMSYSFYFVPENDEIEELTVVSIGIPKDIENKTKKSSIGLDAIINKQIYLYEEDMQDS